jgi:hypothetical protein
MIDPVWYIVLGSSLVHAVGLAWVARHDAAKLLAAWRRRRVTASDLDHAMFTVWLEGNWQWITKKMTTDEREAAVAAVLRYDAATHGDDEELPRSSLAWWEN